MQHYCILLSYLNPQIAGSDPASPGPRKIVPKVSFDSRSQCRQVAKCLRTKRSTLRVREYYNNPR